MKNIFTILFLLFAVMGFSQEPPPPSSPVGYPFFLKDAQGRIITTTGGGILAIVGGIDTATTVLVQAPDTIQGFNITMVNPGDVSTPGLAQGLQAYWSLEETGGGTAFDSVNSYDGTLINAPTQSQTGISNLCYDFDEPSDEWIDFGTSFWDVGTDDLTVALWFKIVGATVSGGLIGNAGTNPDWNIRAQSGSYAKANVNFGTGNIETSTDNIVSSDVWHHLVFQLDRDGTTLLYLDNVLQSEQFDISTHVAVNLANSNHFGIGNDHEGAADYFHNGLIDEVSVYNRLITVTEISQLYNVGAGKFWPYGVIGGDTLNMVISGEDTRSDTIKVIWKYDGWSTDTTDGTMQFRFPIDNMEDYRDTTFLYSGLGDTTVYYSAFTTRENLITDPANRDTVFIDSSDIIPPPQDPGGLWDTILWVDFENQAVSLYTTNEWSSDWNQDIIVTTTGRTSDNRWPSGWFGLLPDEIVTDALTGSKVLKLSFDDDYIDDYWGNEDRGGDYWIMDLNAEYDEMYISYNIQFMPGFNVTAAGKFPGVNSNTPLGDFNRPTDGDGFSARLMWQWEPHGALGFYYYAQNGPSSYYGSTERWSEFNPVGDGLQYEVYDGVSYFVFEKQSEVLLSNNAQWYNITWRIVPNSFTGDTPNYDGLLEGYVNGYLIHRLTGLYMITLPDKGEGIARATMTHFFHLPGPQLDQWFYFDDYCFFTYGVEADVPRGNEVSPPGRILNLPNWPKE